MAGKLAKTLSKRLSDGLAPRGSRADLIRKSGISGQTIDRWLTGENTPDLDQLEAAAAALGRDPIDLLFPGELPKPIVMPPSKDQAIDAAIQILESARTHPDRLSNVKRELLAVIRDELDDSEAGATLDSIRLKLAARRARQDSEAVKKRG